MKQFLVFLLTLVLTLPSYAGRFSMVESNTMVETNPSESDASVTHSAFKASQKHHHHEMMASQSLQDDSKEGASTAPHTMANHDCCDDSDVAVGHSDMNCSEKCSDCNHGCGACVALLQGNNHGLQPQAEQTLLTAVQLPASPYHNPLIPPIISQ